MKKPILLSALGLIVSLAIVIVVRIPQANAQALTAFALLAEADNVVKELNDLVTTVSVEGQKTIGTATTDINGLEDQLRKDVGANIRTPIQNLGANVQNTANTLSYVVAHVNDLLTLQRNCLDLDINLFEAGLQTTVAQAKLGIPLVAAGGPRLNQFVFTGHSPNVVPQIGGPVTLSGFELWTNRAPTVTLVSSPSATEALLTLAASRQSDNDIIVDMPTAILQTRAGECLYLRVQPRHAAFLGLGNRQDTPVMMPFCIPDTALTEYQTAATMSYSCPGQTTSTINTDWQNQTNHSCEHSSSAGGNFGISVPANCRIIGAQPVRGNLTRSEIGATSAAISGETVVLTGQMGAASCTPVIKKVLSDADWQYSVKATIQCDQPTPNFVKQRSAWTVAGQSETDMCVDLQKDCAPVDGASDIIVSVYRLTRGGSTLDNARAILAAQGEIAASIQSVTPLGVMISTNPTDSAPQIGVNIYDKGGSTSAGATLQLPSAREGQTTTNADYTPGVSQHQLAPAEQLRSLLVATNKNLAAWAKTKLLANVRLQSLNVLSRN